MAVCYRLLALLAPLTAAPFGQPADRPGPPPQQTGPWALNLYRAEVDDDRPTGPGAFHLQAAGVPSLCRWTDGRLVLVMQWFPQNEPDCFDQVALQISADDGRSWTPPRRLTVEGLPAGYTRPFDPTIVALPDGRLRVYFTSNPSGSRQNDQRGGIYSAVSSDGEQFAFEPGLRYRNPANEPTYDCAVAWHSGRWQMVTPFGREQGSYAVSTDGLSFERVATLPAREGYSYIGNLAVVAERLRFYGSGRDGLWWIEATGDSWSAPRRLDLRGGDPAVLPRGDGRVSIWYVGAPRPLNRPTPPGPSN